MTFQLHFSVDKLITIGKWTGFIYVAKYIDTEIALNEVQGPRRESQLMGSKPFREIEDYLILVSFSFKI